MSTFNQAIWGDRGRRWAHVFSSTGLPSKTTRTSFSIKFSSLLPHAWTSKTLSSVREARHKGARRVWLRGSETFQNRRICREGKQLGGRQGLGRGQGTPAHGATGLPFCGAETVFVQLSECTKCLWMVCFKMVTLMLTWLLSQLKRKQTKWKHSAQLCPQSGFCRKMKEKAFLNPMNFPANR